MPDLGTFVKHPLTVLDGLVQSGSSDQIDLVLDTKLPTLVNSDSVSFVIGMPLAAQSPGLVRASAADISQPCIGLATLGSAVGVADRLLVSGTLQQTDWTAVVGLSALNPRQLYYLDSATPGKLTTTRPTTAGQICQIVGTGLTSDTMTVTIEQPILL